MRQKVLITGGAGFIGSTLAEYLLDKNYSVRVIDNLFSGSISNLSTVINDIEFIELDIRNSKALSIYCKSVDYIIHLAAASSVSGSIEAPDICSEVNIGASLKLLEIAAQNNVKRFVVASSCAVYGNRSGDNKLKENNELDPLSPYAVSKLTVEYYCKIYSAYYKIPAICLRLFNVYGAKQNINSDYAAVIPRFVYLISNNLSPTIFGDGHQTRDFIYIKDVVSAFEKAINTEATGIFNIASGQSYDINELYYIIAKLSGKDPGVVYKPARKGEVRFSRSDITLAQTKLNFTPQFNLESGLKDLLS